MFRLDKAFKTVLQGRMVRHQDLDLTKHDSIIFTEIEAHVILDAFEGIDCIRSYQEVLDLDFLGFPLELGEDSFEEGQEDEAVMGHEFQNPEGLELVFAFHE